MYNFIKTVWVDDCMDSRRSNIHINSNCICIMGSFSIADIGTDGESYTKVNVFFLICGIISVLNILTDRHNILIFTAIKFCIVVSSKSMYNINININIIKNANKIKTYRLKL